MNAKYQITNESLAEFVGRDAELYCQVGVVLSVTGKLEAHCGLCRWGIRMSNDQTVGFAYGTFRILPNGTVSIQIC